jgi:NADH-quinone oxidoreductase subunit B
MEIKREPIGPGQRPDGLGGGPGRGGSGGFPSQNSILTGTTPPSFGSSPPDTTDFRSRQLMARDMLRGDLDDETLQKYVEQSVMTTTVDKAVAWARGNSFFPLTFGLACCAIEMMSIVGMRVDIARFGFEAFRASPRQADLILLSGRVSIKMAPVVRRIWDQMLEPKYAISMGACCSSMGVFNNYALVPSDKFMPIDVHVPGCPPRPEALAHGILRLREKVQGNEKEGWRERYDAVGTEEILTGVNTSAEAGETETETANINVFHPGDTAGA